MMRNKRLVRWIGWPAALALAYGGVMAAMVLFEGNLAGPGGGNREARVLKRVATPYVCMVNNRVYDREQIPVRVGTRTYYGCCEGCKGRLAHDAQIRVAIDPVSGQVVDKATAVAGALPDGRVYYFESEKNLRAYRPPPS